MQSFVDCLVSFTGKAAAKEAQTFKFKSFFNALNWTRARHTVKLAYEYALNLIMAKEEFSPSTKCNRNPLSLTLFFYPRNSTALSVSDAQNENNMIKAANRKRIAAQWQEEKKFTIIKVVLFSLFLSLLSSKGRVALHAQYILYTRLSTIIKQNKKKTNNKFWTFST